MLTQKRDRGDARWKSRSWGRVAPNANRRKKAVKDALTETGVAANAEKVTDILAIGGYGVFGTPAVVIDGEVKIVGKVPTKEQVKSWLGGTAGA